jgi:hypothetical protein
MANSYEDSIFINCPFDKDYDPFLKCIIYTVYRCGFVPRSAMEEDDSSDSRLDKIVRLIKICKFGIHDISRTQLDPLTNLPRFNMPFELGVFWGMKKNGNKLQQSKVALIFEYEKYSYQKYLSDINGVDIKAHDNTADKMIRHIRNWLYTSTGRDSIPSINRIVKDYTDFSAQILPAMLIASHSVIEDLTFNDFCEYVTSSLAAKMNTNK